MAQRKSAAFAATGVFLLSFGAFASDAYDPPPAYYTPTIGLVGAPLRSALHEVISVGHTFRSYDAARFALPLIDRDPNDATRIILVYNGVSVPAAWDAGVTWNREHTWPDSRGLGSSGMDYSDLHQLRGCNPSINSSRGNDPFGYETGPGGSSAYWDPDRFGAQFRGEMARSMMYMDVRYDGGDPSTTDLVVVNGFPSGSQMGDMVAMLEWHFQQPPSQRERRRNHFVYSSVDNPVYFQGNRNPFVDHPEFVWALFGPTPNSSTLSVGAPLADGSSETLIDLGDFVAGAPDAQASVTIFKAGATPTTFELSTTGDATLAFDGRRQAFVSGPQQRTVQTLLTNLDTPGVRAGTLVVNNTDLTSAAPGQGSQDADDSVTILALVVAGANPSFSPVDDENGAFLELASAKSGVFEVHNIAMPPAAGLDLDSVDVSGDASAFMLDTTSFSALPPGDSQAIGVSVVPGAPAGQREALFTLRFSDADLPGAQPREPLTLIVRATVSACAADLDGDGQVGASDLAAILGAWGGGPGPADVDGDGQVAASDLAAVLGAWGPCP